MTSVPKPFQRAARQARRQGWTITRCGSGHLRWQPPAGQAVFTPATPTGRNRSAKNALAKLRRAGLSLP